jgi:hypothetical protein
MKAGPNLWSASVQLDHPTDNAEAFVFGTEYGISQMLFLRGGYRFNSDSKSYSLGAGLKLAIGGIDGELDYAFADVGDLGNSNVFSFRWGF